jgi:uncharacterized damage-inducible protein DinB
VRNHLFVALLTFAALPGVAAAQSGPVVGSLAGLHETTSQHLVATAEMVSEDLYAFRPTAEVRTLGGILAHVANAQYLFCSAAAGEDSPNTENLEETLSGKAEIVTALQEAFAYCDGVYAGMSDEAAAEVVTFFGQEMARAGVLSFNTAHNYEHYGNLVTYMRINGITPPSSM